MEPSASELTLSEHGAAYFPAAISSAACDIVEALAGDLHTGPGQRLRTSRLDEILSADGAVGRIAASLIGPNARPVRVVIFDKRPGSNWAVAWHQDRTIVVRERCETPGFGPWSTKHGLLHVAPPIAVLEGMVTLRLHLDDCGEQSAPLEVALGSHRFGRVPAEAAAKRAAEHSIFACLASRGDVWAYSTPILHRSKRSKSSMPRKVLQIDFAALPLPVGLAWRGLA